MKTEQDLIFEAYINNRGEVEQDDNDQYAPGEAPVEDQLGDVEPLDDEAEEDAVKEIAKQLGDIVDELRTLNQYANFYTTGTRAKTFK
jgi:hypothetical protein